MRLSAGELSIKAKLILLFLLFLCLPFLVLGGLWYEKSTQIIENNAIHSNQQLVNQVSKQLDSYFADLERSTFPLIIHPLIKDFMELHPGDQYQLFKITQDIEEQLLPDILFGRSDIYGFSILSKNGIASTYGGSAARDRNRKYLADLDNEANYKNMGVSEIDSIPILTVTRKFRDAATYQTKGMLITDLYVNEIARIAENIKLGSAGYVWVIDAGGNIVYHPDRSRWGKAASPEYLEHFRVRQADGYFTETINGHPNLVIFHKSELNDWIMVSEVPINELIGNLIELRNMTLWIAGLLILFVLLAVSGFSFRLTRSLSHLQRLMKKAEFGDLTVRAPEQNQDEIGKLNRSFNKMVSEIRRLIEVVHISNLREKEMQIKQRESALQAMQSQINPHFLYNTLEVINSYAILEGVMPISNMATSLADIFRYSVGNGQQIVKLNDEMDHISTYFSIQQERYRVLKVDILLQEEWLKSVKAVRLMIQPIVENAFIHGYERHLLRPEYIGIIGEPENDYYMLRIADKGKGMSAEKMDRFNKIFLDGFAAPEEPGSEMDSSQSSHSIGLMNVHHRLRLTFGPPFGLWIERSDESGTVIAFKLPYETG